MSIACGECGAPMALRAGKFGQFYGCTRWPECGGVHCAHQQTGEPMGTPADKETRQARIAAHAAFDQLWQSGGMSRKQAYRWLASATGLSREAAHISRMTKEQCASVVRAAAEKAS